MSQLSERIARDVLESLHEGCQVIDPEGRYLYVNDAAARQGQRAAADLVGRTMAECYPGIEATPMYAELRRCMETRAYRRMVNEFEFPDGSKGWFELRFLPVPEGVCVLSLDVTEQRRAEAALGRTEEQLRQATKMEAIGRLAGGIAHDFNNILSIILSHTQLITQDLRPDDPLREDIEQIAAAGWRAADLTRQLLAFSRKQVLSPRVVDLNDAVATSEKMLRRLLGASVELTFLPGNELGKVHVDPSQIDQVVMNLCVNARDAMPSGGRLTLVTRNVHLDEDYARAHHGVRPGDYVMLAVTDTGHGIDTETQARIFEPFFTTKERGKGTGLGLATVFGIVKQSGGHIWVYSEPGHGATFKVYLPKAADPTLPPATARAVTPTRGGHETILLVEDDAQVRAVILGTLRRHGYVVLEAANAGEALLVVEQHPARIHLLLTDLVLPRMGGRQLAERIMPLRPDMRVLFMSGYTDDAAWHHGIVDSDAAYLQKPVTPGALTKKVREVLDA